MAPGGKLCADRVTLVELGTWSLPVVYGEGLDLSLRDDALIRIYTALVLGFSGVFTISYLGVAYSNAL